ncbi:unnamed protein product [Gongylonema pulchrum]|uniref:Protein kinase domain-containing protein n=1 Tax=Gongylonema pulchrum TaxID=637853 RepID=A0A183D1X4_9BILA|nr:unnamed protein product [Gongylonema pulchrum]
MINIIFLRDNLQYGETLRDVRARLGGFTVSTNLKLTYLTIECIEEFHKIGYIHRDIKPSAYAIGLEADASHVYLVGFGLARRYKATGKTTVASHRRQERSRKDDVESWFYMFVEFFLSSTPLPWAGEKNSEEVLRRKEYFLTSTGFQRVIKNCDGIPPATNRILRQLGTYQYETCPDYHLMKNIFRNAIIKGNFKSEKMDWLKGKDSDMVAAGACESRIFGEKTETEKESIRVEEEYVLGPNEHRLIYNKRSTKTDSPAGWLHSVVFNITQKGCIYEPARACVFFFL